MWFAALNVPLIAHGELSGAEGRLKEFGKKPVLPAFGSLDARIMTATLNRRLRHEDSYQHLRVFCAR